MKATGGDASADGEYRLPESPGDIIKESPRIALHCMETGLFL